MGSLKNIFNKNTLLHLNNTLRGKIQQNGMSQYPKYYINPVFNKDEQDKMYETGEVQKIAHLPTRAALADQTCSVFYDRDVYLFTNYVMQKGNKLLARELMERSFEKVKRIQIEKYHKAKTEEEKHYIELDPKKIFHKAVENCKPVLQLTPIKRGGVTYQVPVPLTEKKSQFLSMKWLIAAAKEKEKTVHFPERMAYELIDASNNTGRVIKRKQDLHKQCEANRAYAHYRWS